MTNTQSHHPGTSVFQYDGEHYRVPEMIGGRFRMTGIMAAGGYGLIFKAEDRFLYNKQVLVKINRYPAYLFKHQRDMSRVKAIDTCRQRLDFEKKMLLQAHRRGISGTPVVLDFLFVPHPGLHGPHTDEQGGTFMCEDHDQHQQLLWQNDPCLVLSYVDGWPLTSVIQSNAFQRNLLGNAKQIILQIGRILEDFHRDVTEQNRRLSFIYQDLKPDNIIQTREFQFVLIDFGGFAVRADGRTLAINAKTGTPGYQPPEFLDYAFSPDKIDARADVFSLGATVYHVLSGESPKAGPDGKSVFDKKRLKAMPKPWREWVETATAQEPTVRFADMGAAISASHRLPVK